MAPLPPDAIALLGHKSAWAGRTTKPGKTDDKPWRKSLATQPKNDEFRDRDGNR
jgi:hypothetical protein